MLKTRRAILVAYVVGSLLAQCASAEESVPGYQIIRPKTGPGVLQGGGVRDLKSLESSRAGADLLAIYAEYQQYVNKPVQAGAKRPAFISRNPLARVVDSSIVIDAVAADDPRILVEDLKKLGLQESAVFGRMVSGRLPISAIPALRALKSLKLARPAYMMKNSGNMTSEGDIAIRSKEPVSMERAGQAVPSPPTRP